MTRLAITLLASALLLAAPARADFRTARERFEEMPRDRQTAVVLALVAAGDYEGLAEHGFTRLLYRALLDFETREGFVPDGVLDEDQLMALKDIANGFYRDLGTRWYTHPATGARLLVPRGLFDAEKRSREGYLFTRRDGLLSLIFISIPQREQGYEALWRRLAEETAEKRIVYERRFDSHFVVTGVFHTGKFYTWMARTGDSTTGFTLSWGAPMEEMGRKLSVFLANAYGSEVP